MSAMAWYTFFKCYKYIYRTLVTGVVFGSVAATHFASVGIIAFGQHILTEHNITLHAPFRKILNSVQCGRFALIVGDIIVPKLDLINNGLITVFQNCANTSIMIQKTCFKHYKVLQRCQITPQPCTWNDFECA